MEVMKALVAEKKQFDVVICDPPKLAPQVSMQSRLLRRWYRSHGAGSETPSHRGSSNSSKHKVQSDGERWNVEERRCRM